MKELLQRLLSMPMIASELVLASVFINILALAGPLFVMQVLNRYVTQGVDATLLTLVSGVLIAIILEFSLRQARLRLARGISVEHDQQTAIDSFNTLSKAKISALDQVAPETRREMVNGVTSIETAYNANNITTVLDVPFSLIFIFVLYLLEPSISLVVTCFMIIIFSTGLVSSKSQKDKTAKIQETTGIGSALLGTVTRESDTLRAFNAGDFLRESWEKHTLFIQRLRRDITSGQGLVQTITQSANSLLSVAVIGIGATLVVKGELDVGAMIGANILAARALQPISKFSQLSTAFARARQALDTFANFKELPLEDEKGSKIEAYKGGIEFRDLAFTFSGGNSPLFESLSLKLFPGSVLVVTGANGTGKSTLARLIVGLLEPSRGQIFIDGLDLQQVALEWWRKQVIYLPQEPSLINASISENIRMNRPDLKPDKMNLIINAVGLRKFIDESQNGYETEIINNGWLLSEGIRRRIALARALVTGGNIAIIDEPTESLDAEGCNAIHTILGQLVKRGCSVIIMTHDASIVKGPHFILDLNTKPQPKITRIESANIKKTRKTLRQEPSE